MISKYNIVLDKISQEQKNKIVRELTTTYTRNLSSITINKTRENFIFGKKTRVARFVDMDFGNLKNAFPKPQRISVIEKPEISLKDYQKTIVGKVNEYYTKEKILSGKAGVVLKLKAGLGKTYIAMHYINKFKFKTLVVVPDKKLARQWVELCEKYVKCSIGQYHSSKKILGDVTIVCAKSLISKGFEEFLPQFSFIIYDEVHLYSSEKYQKFMWNNNYLLQMGLSATPDENAYGFDKVYIRHVGWYLDIGTMEGMPTTVFSGTVQAIRYYGKIKTIRNEKTKMVSCVEMDRQLAADTTRMQIAIDKIKELPMCTYVFASTREMLEKLYDALLEQNVPNVYMLVGGSKESEEKEAREKARIILSTYAYMNCGFSVPRFEAELLYSPRYSWTNQTMGRIERIDGNVDNLRLIIDIIDMNSVLKRQFEKRKKIYLEHNYAIEYYDSR